jgi:hypothetical protein
MVQLLKLDQREPKRSFGQEIVSGLKEASQSYQQYQQSKLQEQQYGEENEALKQRGLDLSGIRDPEVRKILVNKFETPNKNRESQELEEQRAETIGRYFGPEAAELYKAAPEGGKTAFLDRLLENQQRGQGVEDLIKPYQKESLETPEEDIGFKAIDYDKGLTPKERVKRQEERYGKNLPLYQESKHKQQSLEASKDALGILEELSPQIKGIQKLNINPQTGELFIPGLASPESQRFVKTVNDFTVNAKDSFGARVSNFELERFMKRLPTLANSEEGRRQIIKQMQIINEINATRENELQKVIEEHGGIRNIDYDRAETIAEKTSSPKIQSLKKEFKNIEKSLDSQYEEKINDKKKKLVTDGRVMIEKDGKHFSVPKNKLKKYLGEGYKTI